MQKLSSPVIACRQCGQVVRAGAPIGGATCCPWNPAATAPALLRGIGGGSAGLSALINSPAVANRLSNPDYDRLKTSSSHLGTLGFKSLGKSSPPGRSPLC